MRPCNRARMRAREVTRKHPRKAVEATCVWLSASAASLGQFAQRSESRAVTVMIVPLASA